MDRGQGALEAVERHVARPRRGQGERVEFAGAKMDPRYRFKNQTIIELLEITPEEERRLKTIISDDERRRRDRERKGSEMSRQEYEGRAQDRRAEASRMAAEGLRVTEIARRLEVSRQHVYKLLKGEAQV